MLRRVLPALLTALGAVLAGALVWVLAVRVAAVGRIDAQAFHGFLVVGNTRAGDTAEVFAGLVDPAPFLILAAALVGVAAARRRPRHALVAVAMLIGSAVTTQLLKQLLASDRAHPPPYGAHALADAWPSGHTTAATALALCLVLVVAPRARPAAAAVAGAFTVMVGYSLIALGHHWPSDVAGGFCVAVAWMAAGVAALRLAGTPEEEAAARRPHIVAAMVGTAAGGAALALALLRPGGVIGYAVDHTSAVALAGALGAAGLALVGATALALRRA